jgi:hypothetical protein
MSLTGQFSDQVTHVVAASLEETWAVVADLDGIGARSPECSRVQWLDGATGPGAGARFRGLNRLGPVRWSTVCTIEEWDPPRRLIFLARHVTGAATRWTYELDVCPEGTQITEKYATADSPRLMMVMDRLARRPTKLRGDMARTLQAVEAAVLRDRA